MPDLSNPKHESMALGLVRGLSADAAYESAGYKRNYGNAARLAARSHIKARVAELTKEISERAVTFAAIDFREQMHKLIRIVDLAIEAGALKIAKDAQEFILTCGGYADSPTLTHEHMSGTTLTLSKPNEPEEGTKVVPVPARRFGNLFEKMRQRAEGNS